MPRALIVSPTDLTPELGRTILWRSDTERGFAADGESGVAAARELQPNVVVIAGINPDDTIPVIRRLRADPVTRSTAVLVLDRAATPKDEVVLREAGANVVFSGPLEPSVWDARLEELLSVPPRRNARIPMRLKTWSRYEPRGESFEGLALNISLRGMLLSTAQPIEIGTRLDVHFELPGEHTTLSVVGRVVRDAGRFEDRLLSGVRFLVHRGDARERIQAFVESEGRAAGAGARQASEAEEWEEELRASEALKSAMLESALDAIIAMDQEGRITEFNRAAEKTFGWSRAEVLGRTVAETIEPPALREQHREGLAHYLATGVGPALDRRLEMTGMHRDGSEFPMEIAVTSVRLDGKAMFTAYLRDITERRLLEEQLRQSQKVEAVGRLAGGIAHDFNNLLSVIIAYTDLLLRSLPREGPQRLKALEILKAADRAAALTSQLLAFSRKQVRQPKVLDLNTVVGEMQGMLRPLMGESIDIAMRLDPEIGRVSADPGQIEQVVMNLAVNARDAMPKGGRLTFETRNVELDDVFARAHLGSRPGPYVLLAVSDTGTGMDPETRRHIFEPFFTTKQKGQGTGLGLATVYGIVKQSEGYIWVRSEPSRGAAFDIYLPRVEGGGEEAAKQQPARAASVGGAETVLLVEDEEALRYVTRETLEASGYRVLEARGAEEAVEISGRHAGPIHVLLTDVVMPGMSGPLLAERLALSRPEMRVLFTSGYLDDALGSHGLLDAGTRFLQKPFTHESLERKLREVLGGTPAG